MSNHFHPAAWSHLQAAQRANEALAGLWNDLVADELFDVRVSVDADGFGCVTTLFSWPLGVNDDMATLFEEWLTQLMDCLDVLVVDAIDVFSVLQRPRRTASRRHFPIAGSRDEFESMVASSCIDGVLRRQQQMISDCQPFRGQSDVELVNEIRTGLNQLRLWRKLLQDGVETSVWLTPVDPGVEVDPPARIETINASALGLLHHERVVATFHVSSYSSESTLVQGRPGTTVDLCLVDGFEAQDREDTLSRRMLQVQRVVESIATYFELFTGEAPTVRRLRFGSSYASSPADSFGRSTPAWLEPRDLDASREAPRQSRGSLTLVVETDRGIFERTVAEASPPRPHEKLGTAAENAIHDAAATWGLPDFVILPTVEAKGAAVREIGDGLLVAGHRGVVVQSKCREGALKDDERERRWAQKQMTAAAKQVDGTARRLKREVARMRNGRGIEITVNGPAIEWVGAIVIDHPGELAEVDIALSEAGIPKVVLLRRDWEFLFEQLRSTQAVISYLNRVRGSADRLGDEPVRYYDLAAADLVAPTGSVDPDAMADGATTFSAPLLPALPAGSDDDQAHAMVRMILEDIARSDPPDGDYDAILSLLASIDTLPVSARTELGRILLSAIATAGEVAEGNVRWQFRSYLAGRKGDQLGFGTCSSFSTEIRDAFRSWVLLRHHDRGRRVGTFNGLRTIGVLLTLRLDGYREWDTTLLAVIDDPSLSEEQINAYRALWDRDGPSV